MTQEARWGGLDCEQNVEEEEMCGQNCCVPDCHVQAVLRNSTQFPCGECVCVPGWAGPGMEFLFILFLYRFKNYFQALCVAMTMMLMAGQM